MLVPIIDLRKHKCYDSWKSGRHHADPDLWQANYMDIDTNDQFEKNKAYTGWNKLSATSSLSVTEAYLHIRDTHPNNNPESW